MASYELSILIPARNEEYLSRTVEDVLANSSDKTEILIGLDGAWAVPTIKDHPRVTILHVSESIGQRAMTNRLCKLSKAKYIMKLDAHCAMDKDFDTKMIADMHDDWTMTPVMRNLHVFNWVCPEGHTRYQGPSGKCTVCGKPTTKDIVWIPKTNPQSVGYCFDPEPHFQYMNNIKDRQSYKDQMPLTESMSLQGSCFMMNRSRYWALNICDELTFGSWGSQGIEVACKTWLSGGRVVINHNTWYAHCFRTQGGDFGFPYEISGKQVKHAKTKAKDIFFKGKFQGQIKPISWLVEKFWPIKGWTDKDLVAIGGTIPEVLADEKATKGIIYYTDNALDKGIMKACQKQIKKCTDIPISSCSLKPTYFGKNTVLTEERGYVTMTKQILTALKALDTDIVYFCEHDVLYHPSHFDFTPKNKNIWYYNENYWFLRMTDGFAISYDCSPLSGLVVYRNIAIKHFEERLALMEADPDFSMYHIGFEPMTSKRVKWKAVYDFETFKSDSPNIDISHGKNVTSKRWSIDKFRKKPTRWVNGNIDTIKGWNNVRKLLSFSK